MPTSRFFGYTDFMNEYNKDPAERVKEEKIRKAKANDWDNEVKEAKRKLWLKKN